MNLTSSFTSSELKSNYDILQPFMNSKGILTPLTPRYFATQWIPALKGRIVTCLLVQGHPVYQVKLY